MGRDHAHQRDHRLLTLSLLNDEGALAFCESDSAVIPSGILLNAISGIPGFPERSDLSPDQIITLAHCTAPQELEREKTPSGPHLTHFESDYGAAPKVEMKIGQRVTNIFPTSMHGGGWASRAR